MNILVACEFSGIVRDAFTRKGHNVLSCDLLPSEKPGKHYQGDVSKILDGWDMIIAHPPCTYLCNSGVSWLYREKGRWAKHDEAALFFRSLWESPSPRICIENPIPHKYAVRMIGTKYTQIIQPWMFGHTEKKATCLWLKGLDPLEPTDNVKEAMLKLPRGQQQRTHWLPPTKDRWKLRSKTFQGIADAMAEAWG